MGGSSDSPSEVFEAIRTRSQVLAEQASVAGCCDRHADNMPCDCLDNAGDDEQNPAGPAAEGP